MKLYVQTAGTTATTGRLTSGKHGIADDDIENAIAKAFIVEPIDQDRMLYIGPDRTANFIEVVTLIRQDGSEITIHAMRMRRQYEKLLPGHD